MTFRNSIEFSARRLVRRAVRKADITKTERDIILALLNLWFKYYATGVIRPGRQKIARKAQCTEKSVSRALGKLRDCGVLKALGRLHGEGQKPTMYSMNLTNLLRVCGEDIPTEGSGELSEMSHQMSRQNTKSGGTPCPTVFF